MLRFSQQPLLSRRLLWLLSLLQLSLLQLNLSQLSLAQLSLLQFSLAHRLSWPPQSLWQLSPMPLFSRPGLLLWKKNRQLSLKLLQ